MKERFSIGEAAEFFGISRDLLRYYEKEGLISPSGQSASRYRQYSFADLKVILAYTQNIMLMQKAKKKIIYLFFDVISFIYLNYIFIHIYIVI